MEKEALGKDGGMGEANGDRPASEISVLEDSAPGEVGPFQPKKELIFLPGVLGCCLESKELADEFRAPAESIRRGGGRLFSGGCRAIAGWSR